MQIGICALGAITQDTGGQTYMVNLVNALQDADDKNEYIIFVSTGEGGVLSLTKKNFRIIEIHQFSSGSLGRIVAEQFQLPMSIKRHGIELMYYPNNFASVVCPAPYVLAIRSMLIYNTPDTTSVGGLKRLYRKSMMPISAKGARHIITPSLHTRSEIIRYLGVDENNIQIIPHGVNLELFGEAKDGNAAARICDQYKIKLPYILYVSALWDYKNHDKLILAFKRLMDEKQIKHQLVFIGRGMNSYESYAGQLRRMVNDYRLEAKVIFIDHLDHDVLRHVYQHADVFVFPSQTESFGHPLFEAMASGIPIVCSNTHGFQELVGDAALTVDPSNIEDLANAIDQIRTNPPLRNELIQAGKKHVEQLSWTSCARKTLKVLETSVN
jgi:glycosyltransferase involved in cell wall biosynthesis